jgi:FkbM family methyltransferase
MKNVHGWYLPDDDTHFTQYLDGLHKANMPVEYQREQREAALKWCDKFNLAVDIGAHVGLWTRGMTDRFKKVIAFEPHEPFIGILKTNAPNAEVNCVALGSTISKVKMEVSDGNSGITRVKDGEGSVSMRELDSFELPPVDFIKIDCEGYELPILEGAYTLLKHCSPVIVVEQKPHKYAWGQHAAVEYLIDKHNFRIVDRVIDDWVLKKL